MFKVNLFTFFPFCSFKCVYTSSLSFKGLINRHVKQRICSLILLILVLVNWSWSWHRWWSPGELHGVKRRQYPPTPQMESSALSLSTSTTYECLGDLEPIKCTVVWTSSPACPAKWPSNLTWRQFGLTRRSCSVPSDFLWTYD